MERPSRHSGEVECHEGGQGAKKDHGRKPSGDASKATLAVNLTAGLVLAGGFYPRYLWAGAAERVATR